MTQENPFYSHISPAETKVIFEDRGWDFESYFRFTFVRNPGARLVSLYNMIYSPRVPKRWIRKAGRMLKQLFAPSFDEWLVSTAPDGMGAGNPPWRKYGTYSIANYVLDGNGVSLVDKVIRLEDIGHELPPLLQRIGIPGAGEHDIPWINRGRLIDSYVDYYTSETRKLVEERYRYDIETYNYEFGG